MAIYSNHLRRKLLILFLFRILRILALKLIHSLMCCLSDSTRCLLVFVRSWGSRLTVESWTKIRTIFCWSFLQTVRILFELLYSNCCSGLPQLCGSFLNYRLPSFSWCATEPVNGGFTSALRYSQFPRWHRFIRVSFFLQGYKGPI